MMKQNLIISVDDPEAAQRYFQLILRDKGYSGRGIWFAKGEAGRTYEMAINNTPLRAILWPYRNWWEAMLALKVGKTGELPIAGGQLAKWKPPRVTLIEKKLPLAIEALDRWQYLEGDRWVDCLVDLALFEIGRESHPRAEEILHTLRKGEFSQLTISDSLELAQMKWGSRREEILQIGLIWFRVYEPE